MNLALLAPRNGLVKRGLIAEYRFDDGSGQILHDYSGNGFNGQLGSTTGVDTNDPTWNGQGLSFTTDDYVKLPYMINAEQDFTIYLVANVPASAPSISEYFITLGSSIYNNQRIAILLSTNGYVTATAYDDNGINKYATIPMTPGIRLLKLKKEGLILYLKDVVSKNISSLEMPSGPITLNQISLGSLLRITASSYLNQPEYYASFYNRATTDAEDKQIYSYLKRLLSARGVAM